MNISALQREGPGTGAGMSQLSAPAGTNDPKLKGYQEKLQQLQADLNDVTKDRLISNEEKQEKRRQIRQQMAEVNREIQATKREEQLKKAAESKVADTQKRSATVDKSDETADNADKQESTVQSEDDSANTVKEETKAAESTIKTDSKPEQELEDISLPPRKVNKLIAATTAADSAGSLQNTANGLGNQMNILGSEMHTDKLRNVDTDAKAKEKADLSDRQDRVSEAARAQLQKATEKTKEILEDETNKKQQNMAKVHFMQSQQAQQNALGITSASFHVSM